MELLKQIDETISFNENNIRVIGTYNEPWFVAKDICNILDLPNVTNAVKILPEKWRGLKLLSTFGGEQNMNIINEAGLYKLIMRSNKPIAQKFQEVVCEEILPSLRRKGEYKIQSIIDKNKELEEEKLKIINENKEKDTHIKILENKILNRQNRVQYKDKNCIYILTTDIHLINRTYIIGQTVNLTHRLSSYNKTLDHHVVYSKGCKSIEHMHVIEKMVLYKLDKFREKANRDRFILPEDIDISFFIKIVDDAINWFEDVDEYVHTYTNEELDLSNEELQEKYTENIKNHEIELKNKKSETDRLYRENNKEKKAEMDKIYREENIEKITQNKKEYYENNKVEIAAFSKEYYKNNKTEILSRNREYQTNNKDIIKQVRKLYREENKDKIKEQKKIYREKYKEQINKKQNEVRKLKDNPLIECECGIKLKIQSSKNKKHLNSKAHTEYIKNKFDIN
jgi:prophage antirepressor-like protein